MGSSFIEDPITFYMKGYNRNVEKVYDTNKKWKQANCNYRQSM